jgi:hypothetical protein
MAIGMSRDEFWLGDVCAVLDYGMAHTIRQADINHQMWVQGLYVYRAIGAFREIIPAFPKKGAKIDEYNQDIMVPFSQWEKEQQEESRERQKYAKFVEYLLRGSAPKEK